MRIRSWNRVVEKRTVSAAEILLQPPRACSTDGVDCIGVSEQHPVYPRAQQEHLITVSAVYGGAEGGRVVGTGTP